LPDLLREAAEREGRQTLVRADVLAEVDLRVVDESLQGRAPERALEVQVRPLAAGGGAVQVVLELLLEEEVAVLADLDARAHVPGQLLEGVVVEVPVVLPAALGVEDVGPERAPGGRVERVAELVAEAETEVRVVVAVEGLVEAAAHGPEEALADDRAPDVRIADVGQEEPCRALVLADGEDDDRGVER